MEIVIQPDGSIRVSRSTPDENQLIADVFCDMISKKSREELTNFFNALDDKEQIFGDSGLCG